MNLIETIIDNVPERNKVKEIIFEGVSGDSHITIDTRTKKKTLIFLQKGKITQFGELTHENKLKWYPIGVKS